MIEKDGQNGGNYEAIARNARTEQNSRDYEVVPKVGPEQNCEIYENTCENFPSEKNGGVYEAIARDTRTEQNDSEWQAFGDGIGSEIGGKNSPFCLKVLIKILNTDAKLPNKQTSGSAGYDLFSAGDYTIEAKQIGLVKLGFAMKLPVGHEAQIRSRSGLAFRNQVFVLNSPGTIDSDYRDEVGVLLMNLSDSAFEVKKGDRIAQMIFARVASADFGQVEDFSDRNLERIGGWGSTGK